MADGKMTRKSDSDDSDRRSRSMADQDDRIEENGIDSGGDDDCSDASDYRDDISDDELLGDLLKQKPNQADGIDSVIVVDNIPVVGPERLEKLKTVLRKIFSKYGTIAMEYYPLDGAKTKGFVFLEYKSPDNAMQAVAMMNNYKLDKQHTFAVNMFSDISKFMNTPDKWSPPEKQSYKDHGNLLWWLLDPDCNDHYSVIYEAGERTAVFKHTISEPVQLEERQRWTETYVRWSPRGSFLATVHQKGIAVWGGVKFNRIARLHHPGVQLVDFSPCEQYLISFSPLVNRKEDEPSSIIIWHINSSQKKRGFRCDQANSWPVFKWSHDGKYFARIGVDEKAKEDILSVYETPSFGLLEKKSFKIPGIKEFLWSPSDNIISYWVPEKLESPARVVLINIPSREELSMKNLFNVVDAKMYWQQSGDFFCVKVDQPVNKSKKLTKYKLELFRMREKQVPVDVVEIKEVINAFAWEPTGSKFCILHGESPRIAASFYKVNPKGQVDLIQTMDKKTANQISWNPKGQFVVLAGLRSMNGQLEFIDTDNMTVMNQQEHFMATDVEWDPTGRYVATCVSWWGHKVDNAYWMWTFQGRLLQKNPMEKFCQLLWRPRPPTLLTDVHEKAIKRQFKQYQKQYEIKDRMTQSKASKEMIEKRRQLMTDFNEWYKSKRSDYYKQRSKRLELRDGVDMDQLTRHLTSENEESGDTEDEAGFAEEVIEFLTSEKITIVDPTEIE